MFEQNETIYFHAQVEIVTVVSLTNLAEDQVQDVQNENDHPLSIGCNIFHIVGNVYCCFHHFNQHTTGLTNLTVFVMNLEDEYNE